MKNKEMTVLVSGIKLPLHAPASDAIQEARRRLRGVRLLSDGVRLTLHRRSVDARDKENIRFVYSVAATGAFPATPFPDKKKDFSLLETEVPKPVFGDCPLRHSPVVVGSGPCGLFCALLLAENGYTPVLLERGGTVKERQETVKRFVLSRALDPDTNIQFGAGGAGTFSDGKLVSRAKDPFSGYVMDRLIEFGAPEEIRWLAKPHVGTDILSHVVERILARIEALGGRVLYHTRLLDLILRDGALSHIRTTAGEMGAEALVLAIGPSARDTYSALLKHPLLIEPKPFSVGMRIEHLQEDIDRAMYGKFAGDPVLGHAEYTLSHNTKVRGVYTFCMCPGGQVVAAAGEEGGTVVNGMSYHARDGKNANSAVVCSVTREDYGNTPTGAIEFQRRLERAAYRAGGGNYNAPLTLVGDFLEGRMGTSPTRILPTYMDGKGVTLASPDDYLPPFVANGIRDGLRAFGKQIEGFDTPDALLTGVETRTSAPLRIVRGEDRTAIGVRGIYPAGEGAGYAGGITSAAIDGIRTALAIMAKYRIPKKSE